MIPEINFLRSTPNLLSLSICWLSTTCESLSIAMLRKLRSLTLQGCFNFDNSLLRALSETLTELDLARVSGVTNLSALGEFKSLRVLRLPARVPGYSSATGWSLLDSSSL